MADVTNFKPRGKGIKAHYRVEAINAEMETIIKTLEDINTNLKKVISSKNTEKEKFLFKFTNSKDISVSKHPKRKSMINDVPNRIEFILNNIKFYIDFTMSTLERNDLSEIIGNIIYGAGRTLCFASCIFPNKKNNKECENCERIARCDRLEDKPLVHFTINRNGLIQSNDEFEGELWKTDIFEDLIDLHYRAIDLIFAEALEWTNEKILP